MWKWFQKRTQTCGHAWQVIARTYLPPVAEATVIQLIDHDRRLDAAQGCTSLLFSCCLCQELKVVEMLGALVPVKDAEPYEPRSFHPRDREPN